LLASRVTGRPVKWTASRTEAILSDTHGRDNVTDVELALDENGIFLAVRARTIVNLGAYVTNSTPNPATNNV
ncbi:MAG: molybdopterin-dependent oxidoreductase, partial [Gemmatimonadetes bacterium]|nr:molybdopterin-dependent oxidoreductase [Gemmatimonadota bacterium]NIR84119.1 molybdopterin-dependent oxidoreductase [Gammaproteobacteria bacterium]NIT67417.1 molybdopterin-dependent oxidoreductase [Gemmatimonadota bacterium]NIV24124.1 molybdopterin-dependent oxidoreductase [Gemmatimonadota bacterium]NIW76034.1 molybdopterin-dependent oxidoreductase [Gemmatimonadota bacterium]